MALVLADRVRETTTTTGTGSVTLAGAYTGFQTFSAGVGTGNSTYYTIANVGSGEWEVGIGSYTSGGNTLSRTTVLASSNSGSLVNFGAGSKDVFVTQPAERALYVASAGTGLESKVTAFTNGGIVYASSTSALSTGSALVFDGTNLGVGVTPSAWASSWRAIQITGTSGNSGGSIYTNAGGTTGQIGIAQNWYWNGTNNLYLATAAASDYYQYAGTHVWRNASSGTAGNTVTLTQAMTLDASGNLGVGTTLSTSDGTLTFQQIGQTAIFAGQPSAEAMWIGSNYYYNGGWKYKTSNPASQFYTSGGAFYWKNITSGSANAGITWNSPMTLDASGNLGIGSTSPIAKLDISGISTTQNGLRLTATSGGQALAAFTADTSTGEIRIGGTVAAAGNYFPVFYAAGSERARIDTSGNLGLGVTPSAWATSGTILKAFQIGAAGSVSAGTVDPSVHMTQNAYFDGTSWRYIQTASAGNYYISGNTHNWRIAPSGTAGNAITFTQAMTLDASSFLTVIGGATIQGLTIGLGAGAVSTNTAVGSSALATNSSAGGTTALGYEALKVMTAGDNTAVGFQSSVATTTGFYNSSFGTWSLKANTTGSNNTAIGRESLQANTTASNNTAVGYQTGYTNSAGTNNSYFGFQSGYYQTGSSNTAHGYGALVGTAGVSNTGTNSTAIGSRALIANYSGGYNTAIGADSLQANTTASYNTAVGYQAAYANTTAVSNVAVGYQAMYNFNTSAGGNVAIGDTAMYDVKHTIGTNIAIGLGAMRGVTATGTGNIAIGQAVMYPLTTGQDNTIIGGYSTATEPAGRRLTSGSYNVGLGSGVLAFLNSGTYNTAVGYQAGYTSTTAQLQTCVGYQAGYGSTGSSNTFVGNQSGVSMTTGSKNTILGAYNGNQGSLDIRTASNYIVLSDGDGNPAAHRQWGAADWSFLGSDATATSGIQFRNNANTKYWAISTNTTTWYLFDADSSNYVYLSQNFTAWTFVSDQRLKKDIEDIDYGLSAVMAIRPRRYTYKTSGKNDIGFIAQELRDVIPEAVSGQEAEYLETDTNEDKAKKSLGISRDTLIPVLVKAIQELKAEVDSLKSQLNGA